MKTPSPLPNLDNATPSFLADELGTLRAQLKVLKQKEGIIRDALVARMQPSQTVAEGENYTAQLTHSEQRRLDTQTVRQLLTAEQLEECTKVVAITQVRTTQA